MVRLLFLLLLIVLINFAGCNTIYRKYINPGDYPAAEAEKMQAIRGSINVILLPGYAEDPVNQDTLFTCLKLSRDVNPKSVKLPPDEELDLGHVAEFITRSLKHYQLRESFNDFYGCRIILKFRKLTPDEMRSKKLADYSRFAVNTVGMVAGLITWIPFNAILFAVDGVKTEIDRQDFEDRAVKMDLPRPKKGAIATKLAEEGRALLNIKDEIGQELTGKASARIQFNETVSSYLIEECTLERATPKEIALYKKQVWQFKNFN